MKRIIFMALALITTQCFSQTSNSLWGLCINQSQTIRSTDSLVLTGTLTATDGFGNITWTCSTANGSVPSSFSPSPIAITNTPFSGTSTQVVRGFIPGVYTFTAIGLSTSGTTGRASTTITVVAPPPLRTVTGWTGSFLNGVYKFIYTYSDGQP